MSSTIRYKNILKLNEFFKKLKKITIAQLQDAFSRNYLIYLNTMTISDNFPLKITYVNQI